MGREVRRGSPHRCKGGEEGCCIHIPSTHACILFHFISLLCCSLFPRAGREGAERAVLGSLRCPHGAPRDGESLCPGAEKRQVKEPVAGKGSDLAAVPRGRR